MPFKEATIDSVSVKELPQPDKWENTHKRSIKIGEDWYQCGSSKFDKFNVKQDGEWVDVTKGCKVEFMYKENGNFKNVDMKTLTVVAKGEAPAPKASAPKGGKAIPQNKDFVNPAEVGQCLNLAADVLGLGEKDLLNPKRVKEAIQWYKEVRELFTELYHAVTTEVPKKKAPVKKKTPEPEYDEDIPFEEDEDI